VKFLPTSTSFDEAERGASVAVLPVGSFEQHGHFLPLTTDTMVACAIAESLANKFGLFLLPPVSFGCSHEHAGFAGTISIGAVTLCRVIEDIRASLELQEVRKLVLVNGHGGNYVLGNIVQEANVDKPRMALFPHRDDWEQARKTAGMATSNHEDMHGGELEVSILLAAAPEAVREIDTSDDHMSSDRTHLHIRGMAGYTESGIVGRPSLGDATKGKLALEELTAAFEAHLRFLLD